MAITLDGSTGITDANGGTVLNTTATQTLTNKTLTSPTITGATITGSTVSGGTIVQGTAQASTSGTAIDFTGIPSWAKRVTVMLSNVSTNGAGNFLFQLGISSGIVSSGYNSSCVQLNTSSTAVAASTSITSGFGATGISATNTYHGAITFENLSGNTWVGRLILHGEGGTVYVIHGAGSVVLSGVLDRVRVTNASSNTFDFGTINIMYEG